MPIRRGQSAVNIQCARSRVGTATANQRSSGRDVNSPFIAMLSCRYACATRRVPQFRPVSSHHKGTETLRKPLTAGPHALSFHSSVLPSGAQFDPYTARVRRMTHHASLGYPRAHMGMPSLLRKVFLLDLLQGLKVTFRYQDPKENYTEQYPLERPQVAERYRGAPRLNVNPDTDETMCIACDLCALACPEHLIVVSSERNEKTRRKELTNFTYDLSRCMFCGLCEDACPTDAL